MADRVPQRQRETENSWVAAPLAGRDRTFNGVEDRPPKPVKIKVKGAGVPSVAFLDDGKHIVVGGNDTKIRCWLVGDGKVVGTPMDADDKIHSLAVPQDGKWIVAGTSTKIVAWDAKTRQKVNMFEHGQLAPTMLDISPDGTKVASACSRNAPDGLGSIVIWSLLTGRRLFKWQLTEVSTIKFSPDGRLLAAARGKATPVDDDFAIRIYDCETHSTRLVHTQFPAYSIAWTGGSKQLFALASNNSICCIDASSGSTLSEWSVLAGSFSIPRDVFLSTSSDDMFIAASANSSISFWDIATHRRIGAVVDLPYSAKSMTMSAEYIVISIEQGIILYNLRQILPSQNSDSQNPPSNCKESHQLCRDELPNSNQKIAELKKSVQKLCAQLAGSRRSGDGKTDSLETTIKLLCEDIAAQNVAQNEKMADLEKTIQVLRTQLTNLKHTTKEEDTTHVLTHRDQKMRDLEATGERLRARLANSQQGANSLIKILRTQCEGQLADGHVIQAAELLLEIRRSVTNDMGCDAMITDWLLAFGNKCIIELERIGDWASGADKHNQALVAYVIALSLSPSAPNALFTKWACTMLLHSSINEVVESAREFKIPSVIVYQAICDALERHGRITEAIECFQQVQSNLPPDTGVNSEWTRWELDFRRRCAQGLQKLADIEMSSHNYNKADRFLSTILSLGSLDRVDVLIKRSEARAMMKSWEDALGDADEAVTLGPSSPLGYERRRAALHGMKRYAEAVDAFDTAISKLEDTSNGCVHGGYPLYTDARPKIREIINETLSNMPLELIDTKTGHLLDRRKQAEVFEADSIFHELVSSMATRIDTPRIQREVTKFFRYVMLSHRWQLVEPRYQDVKNTKVSDLHVSFAKLRAFCQLVCSLGFQWAWCDTCCVDQDNTVVLQESLVAMFTWYRGSTLTIVYLHDVPSGSFSESEWNRRAWTYQEYVAAETVRFYTKYWEPYLGSELWNHKKSPDIISEMQRISQVTAAQMAVLRPGRDKVREKLFLASKRLSTRVEDTAYSLLGIFGVSIPVIYGEGTRAVGRFLEHILKGSGDLTILAWTGTANEYNSCLPLNLIVYDSLEPPHVPHMQTATLDREVSKLSPSIPDLAAFFEALKSFSLPSNSVSLDSGRLRLHCISFPISELVLSSGRDIEAHLCAYHATTAAFGEIEIKTTNELNVENEHFLIHPWIPSLLSQEYARRSVGLDETRKALRLVVRLRQPFGALLLEKVSWVDYKRVAADSLIKVRIPDGVPLLDLVNNVETIFVQ